MFDLKSGSIGLIDSYNDYSEMFWPPSTWVCSTVSV